MIVKGVISAIKDNKVAVILPEYDNITTGYLPVYGGALGERRVNDFVLVVFFNNDFSDGIVLGGIA